MKKKYKIVEFLRSRRVEKQGYVQRLAEPTFCTNPLAVAEKYDLGADTVKLRPVLDLSRLVNLVRKFRVTVRGWVDIAFLSKTIITQVRRALHIPRGGGCAIY
jgi:hypothetical protein